MSIIEILMYSIGSVFFLSALLFTYYSIKCARLMKGALGRKMMAYSGILFILAGIIGTIDAVFFPGRGLVYGEFFFWLIALSLLIFGGFWVGKVIQKIIPYSLLKIACIHPGSIYNLIGVCLLVFFALPVFTLDVFPAYTERFSWYSVISIAVRALAFINLAIAARIHYSTAEPAAAAAAAGGMEEPLLRDDLRGARAYVGLTNRLLVTIIPTTGVKAIRAVLNGYTEKEPLLLGGVKINEGGALVPDQILKNLDRINDKERIPALFRAFSKLNAKLIDLYSSVTSPELATMAAAVATLEETKLHGEILGKVGVPLGRYNELLYKYRIFLHMPSGIGENEKAKTFAYILLKETLERTLEKCTKNTISIIKNQVEDIELSEDGRIILDEFYKKMDKLPSERRMEYILSVFVRNERVLRSHLSGYLERRGYV